MTEIEYREIFLVNTLKGSPEGEGFDSQRWMINIEINPKQYFGFISMFPL